MAYLNHPLPTITALIRNEYLFNRERGFNEYTPCDIHTVASIEKRVPLFEALLENGVNWTRRPITAFCWKKDAPVYELNIHMYWDSFSPYIDCQVRPRLHNLRAKLIDWTGKIHTGVYLFTLDWSWENRSILNTNFSETPEHKCGHMFKMDCGNFFCYPNNRIIWHDDAWIHNPISKNPGYRIDMTEYSVENTRNTLTDNSYMTEFNKSESNNV